MGKPPRRFWTSDQHIGHKRVATVFRPFATVADHDKALAEAWDSAVRPNDIVYVLGDIAINPRRDRAFEWFVERPGIKHLITGNHDAVHPLHGSRAFREQSRAIEARGTNVGPSWFDAFQTINHFGMTTVNGQKLMMSHFPYQGEGDRDMEDRYSEFRLRNEDHALVHGHTHATKKISSILRRSIHVGVDAWNWTPVSEAQISDWLAKLNRFYKKKEEVNS